MGHLSSYQKGEILFLSIYSTKAKSLIIVLCKKLGQYPKLVLDGNKLPENSDLDDIWLSRNGQYIAYSLVEDHSHWQTISVQDLQENKPSKESLKDMHGTELAWKGDNSGFYYTTLSRAEFHPVQKVFFHKVGTSQDEDEVIYCAENSSTSIYIQITNDDKYLVLSCEDTYNLVYSVELKPLSKSNSKAFTILDKLHYPIRYVGNNADSFYFITFLDAPLGKLVELKSVNKPSKRLHFNEVIPERETLLRNVYIYPDYMVAYYVTNAGSVLCRTSYSGKLLGETTLSIGAQIVTTNEAGESNKFLAVEGHLTPRQIFYYKSQTDELSLISSDRQVFDSSKYITEKLSVQSKDGINLVVYLNYKKSLKRNGNNPTILTAYGGFGEYCTPSYSARNIAWMECGGIFAEAIIRGDGDFGWNFQIAGKRTNKQNTINDFISVAEYLVEKRFTSVKQLGITGISHGGLIIASALIQKARFIWRSSNYFSPIRYVATHYIWLLTNKGWRIWHHK